MSECEFCAKGHDCSASQDDWYCTREAGHPGPHVACAGPDMPDNMHKLQIWERDDNQTEEPYSMPGGIGI